MFVYISFTLGDRAPGVAPIFVTSKVRIRAFLFLEQYETLHFQKSVAPIFVTAKVRIRTFVF